MKTPDEIKINVTEMEGRVTIAPMSRGGRSALTV